MGGCKLNKHTNLVWIVALVLGWGFDFLFWGKPIGINFAIYLTACLLGGCLVLLTNERKPAFKSLWLVLPFIFFATITFLRQEPLTIALSIMGTLISLGFADGDVPGRALDALQPVRLFQEILPAHRQHHRTANHFLKGEEDKFSRSTPHGPSNQCYAEC